jgi:hypothetical protein
MGTFPHRPLLYCKADGSKDDHVGRTFIEHCVGAVTAETFAASAVAASSSAVWHCFSREAALQVCGWAAGPAWSQQGEASHVSHSLSICKTFVVQVWA